MVEVVLLGTGTPVPDPARSGSGVAVVHEGRWVLVDCGRGVTQRVMEAGLDLAGLEAVVLTHHHSDHVSDLATLAIARWVDGEPTPLRVVAPSGPCARFARACLDGFEDQAFYSQANADSSSRPSVSLIEFTPTEHPRPVFEKSSWVVSSALVDHAPIEAAVGYRVEVGGRVVAVSGDTARCIGIERLAVGADLLIHEALRSDRASPASLAWNASALSVGELALELDLSRVVLTHLLPAPRSAHDERAFVDEARSSGYSGEVIVAHDLMRLTVPSRPC
jgi:ribonuclease Z